MKSSKTIAVFGCKSTTQYLLEFLREEYSVAHLITIDPEKGHHFSVADYHDLTAFAADHDIVAYQAHKYSLKSEEDIAHIQGLGIDIAFVMGWQRLVPPEVLASLRVGAFGMHGSALHLPRGRGRSPMNWSILEGKKVFYTSLFKYDAGADSGQVVDTLKFTINEHDTGETMHFKNTLAMKHLVKTHLPSLIRNDFALSSQMDVTPTYYPKRSEEDSLIDWQDDVFNIERLVRAVTKPFNGAYSFVNNTKITIYRATIFDLHEFGHTHTFPGTVVEIFPNGKFVVKGLGGLLLVHEYQYDATLSVEDVLSTGEERKRHFTRNLYGDHDLAE